MRTTRLSLAAALLAATLPLAAHAQGGSSSRPISIGFGGGVIVPRQGASARSIAQGVQGQGFVVLRLPAGLPALRANVDFARMRLQPGPLAPVVPGATAATPEETTRSLLAGVASLKLDLLHGPVRPYVLAGVGAFHLADEAPDATIADDASKQLDFGVEGGAGISLRLGPISAFAETRLQNVYTKQKGLIDTKAVRAFPVTFGISI